ncbi:MAG: ATP-binding protein [Bacteroidota bacterium]
MRKQEAHILQIEDLYELALNLGGGVNFAQDIEGFLKLLSQKKKLTYVSLWQSRKSMPGSMRLLMSYPAFKSRVYQSTLPKESRPHITQSLNLSYLADPIPESLQAKGALSIIPLSHTESLKMYNENRGEVFSKEELDQLKPVLKRFAQLLKTFVAHQRYENELIAKSHYAAKLRSIVDAALDAFIIINADSQIVEWNPMAEKIFGWKQADILGKKLGDTIVPAEFRQGHSKGMKRFLGTEKSKILNQRIEIEAERKTGERFPLELSIVPVKTDQGYIFCGYARDITLIKEKEEQQKVLLSELEMANRELKDFAHVVSHDLKAPLRAIKNLSEWISTDYEDELGPEGKEQFELLKERVDGMKDLINGILEYSQIGHLETDEKEVDLGLLIEDIQHMLAPPEDIHISTSGNFPKLFINEAGIRQVFLNLISNAIKYSDKEKGEIEIGYQEEEAQLCFWVKDNGPGIKEEDFDKVFRIFETLSYERDYNSSGIGLAIVKKILQNLEGKIWLESLSGKGTTFYFSLPSILKQNKLAQKGLP